MVQTRFALYMLVGILVAGCDAQPQRLVANLPPTELGVLANSRAPAERSHARGTFLYLSFLGVPYVQIASYPGGKPSGRLKGFDSPGGMCTDDKGNLFVTDYGAQSVVEFSRGHRSPTATLSVSGYVPVACAVDGKTGTVAVANQEASSGGPGNVAIFTQGKEPPTFFADRLIDNYASCTYDNKGNLFVVSGAPEGPAFAELQKGESKFTNLKLPFDAPVYAYWDGTYVAVGSAPDGRDSEIYRLLVSGKKVTVQGAVPLDDGSHRVDLRSFWIGNRIVVAASQSRVGFWSYPAGENPVKVLTYRKPLEGVAVAM
jgi:hypothetical protein